MNIEQIQRDIENKRIEIVRCAFSYNRKSHATLNAKKLLKLSSELLELVILAKKN